MTPLTDRLKEIAERVEKAAPGPWMWRNQSVYDVEGKSVASFGHSARKPIEREVSGQFITHARTDIPALLRLVDVLVRQRDFAHRNAAEAQLLREPDGRRRATLLGDKFISDDNAECLKAMEDKA